MLSRSPGVALVTVSGALGAQERMVRSTLAELLCTSCMRRGVRFIRTS
jgi:hypothetical protein